VGKTVNMDEDVEGFGRRGLGVAAGQVYRHGPKDELTLICGATRVGQGMWLTVSDRGAYGGRVYGQHQGTMVLVDLWIHPADGGAPMPIEWASQLALKPIVALYVPDDIHAPTVDQGDLSISHAKDYVKFYRRGGDHENMSDRTQDVYEGCVYAHPWLQRYDVENENALAVAVRGDMGYRMPVTRYGEPVVSGEGAVLGVIIGSDWGIDSSHAGFYVPIDLIAPCLKMVDHMALRMKANRETEYRVGIDRVRHQSNDVYFA
jgi:hypothetical protein